MPRAGPLSPNLVFQNLDSSTVGKTSTGCSDQDVRLAMKFFLKPTKLEKLVILCSTRIVSLAKIVRQI